MQKKGEGGIWKNILKKQKLVRHCLCNDTWLFTFKCNPHPRVISGRGGHDPVDCVGTQSKMIII